MKKVEGKEPTEQLEAYFDMFRTIHSKGERMCPGGSFGAVFDAVSSPVQRTLHHFSQMHLRWLEKYARVWNEVSSAFAIRDRATSPCRFWRACKGLC